MGTSLITRIIVFSSFSCYMSFCVQLEPGVYEIPLKIISHETSTLFGFVKNMFQGTEVGVTVISSDCSKEVEYNISWNLRYSDCYGLYAPEYEANNQTLGIIYTSSFDKEQFMFEQEQLIDITISKWGNPETCDGNEDDAVLFKPLKFEVENRRCYTRNSAMKSCTLIKDAEVQDAAAPDAASPDAASPNAASPDAASPDAASPKAATPDAAAQKRRRRALDTEPVIEKTTMKPPRATKTAEVTNKVTNATRSGSHIFILSLTVIKGEVYSLQVKIDMKSKYGYLSAHQYPLLKFYGVMCGMYSILAFTWILLLARQWRELLGIQFWIGAVILLGLIEKAVFYSEYEHMNIDGTSTSTSLIFPELVSCMKRTLARLLVIVVSIGYGITRPRLGQDFHWLMITGGLYFVLSSLEAVLRVTGNKENELIAVLPLSILDAVIAWWIFKNLVNTTRTLRLRHNITKLWLYRHFTNALILCIIFSIAYFFWQFKMHKFANCVKNWSELWLDDAFWHILFCVILIAIMILLRPTVNNQRYAYSPLTDDREDEESKEPMLSDAYDGMKMRNVKKDDVRSSKDADDDLKWVEENIPAAIADTALATFDDSEEELVTNLERNKME